MGITKLVNGFTNMCSPMGIIKLVNGFTNMCSPMDRATHHDFHTVIPESHVAKKGGGRPDEYFKDTGISHDLCTVILDTFVWQTHL
jgi:hypothetical protein